MRLTSQTLVWEKPFSNLNIDGIYNFYDLKELSDGSIIALFSSSVTSDPDHEYPVVLKLSKDGEEIWTFYKIETKKISPRFISENSDGSINLVCFWVRNYGLEDNTDFRPIIYYLDNNGKYLNEYIDSLSVQTSIFSASGPLIQKNNKNYFNFGARKNKLLLKEYDSNATFISEKLIDSFPISNCYPLNVINTNDGGYLINGIFPRKFGTYYLMKFDNDFKKEWFYYKSNDTDRIRNIKADFSHNTENYTLFSLISPGFISDSLNRRYILEKMKLDTTTIWFKEYYFNRNTEYMDIIHTSDNGYLAVGDSLVYGYYSLFTLLKLDSFGNIKWEKSWGEKDSNNIISKALESNDGNIYLMGRVGKKLYIARYSNITNVEENPKLNDFSISPIPASDFLEISYSDSKHTLKNVVHSDIAIFNVFGVKIPFRLTSSIHQEGNLRLDVSGLPHGVYFVKVGEKVGKFVKM